MLTESSYRKLGHRARVNGMNDRCRMPAFANQFPAQTDSALRPGANQRNDLIGSSIGQQSRRIDDQVRREGRFVRLL